MKLKVGDKVRCTKAHISTSPRHRDFIGEVIEICPGYIKIKTIKGRQYLDGDGIGSWASSADTLELADELHIKQDSEGTEYVCWGVYEP